VDQRIRRCRGNPSWQDWFLIALSDGRLFGDMVALKDGTGAANKNVDCARESPAEHGEGVMGGRSP